MGMGMGMGMRWVWVWIWVWMGMDGYGSGYGYEDGWVRVRWILGEEGTRMRELFTFAWINWLLWQLPSFIQSASPP